MTARVPLVVIGDPATVSSDGTVMATLVTVPEPAEMVLQPNPVPLVQIKAFVVPLHDGTDNAEGVVAVNAPKMELAVKVGNCARAACPLRFENAG